MQKCSYCHHEVENPCDSMTAGDCKRYMDPPRNSYKFETPRPLTDIRDPKWWDDWPLIGACIGIGYLVFCFNSDDLA